MRCDRSGSRPPRPRMGRHSARCSRDCRSPLTASVAPPAGEADGDVDVLAARQRETEERWRAEVAVGLAEGPGDVAVEERLAEEADDVAEGLEEHRRDPADGACLLRYQQHLERAEAPRIGVQGQWAKPHPPPILRRGPVAHRGFCSGSGVACGVRRASKRRCVDWPC